MPDTYNPQFVEPLCLDPIPPLDQLIEQNPDYFFRKIELPEYCHRMGVSQKQAYARIPREQGPKFFKCPENGRLFTTLFHVHAHLADTTDLLARRDMKRLERMFEQHQKG